MMTLRIVRAVMPWVAVCACATQAWAELPRTAPASASAPASAHAPEYRLGSGDQVRISVFQNPDLSLDGRISEAGTLSFPLLGSVKLGGMTLGEAETALANGLAAGNYVKQPQVSVLLLQVRGNQASVLGQANRPGRYPIEVADMRLSDLLALAGGVATTGSDTVILVGRRNGQRFRTEVDVDKMFRSEDADGDLPIQSGDVVYVQRGPTVYIYGQVQRAGAMRLERGMTVMQALATGGGLTTRGTERGVRVHRKAADGKIEVIQPSLDDPLRDGDVLYVRESLF